MLHARAYGDGAAGLALRIEVGSGGSLADQAEVRVRECVIGAEGSVIFQWYEWPRNGPARDFVSVVTAVWESEGVQVYLEDLFD